LGAAGLQSRLARAKWMTQEGYRHLQCEKGEFEIGSIGIQDGAAWAWGIDTFIPMRAYEAQGEGSDSMHEAVQGGLGKVQRRSC
jgi:hypothetical protein